MTGTLPLGPRAVERTKKSRKAPRLPLTDSWQEEEKNKIHRLDMEARSKFKMAVLESDARRPGSGLE